MRLLTISAAALLLLSGCSKNVRVQSLKSAQIDRASQNKKIAVLPFENDDIDLSSNIESSLFEQKINHKRYFTIISRQNIDDILKEQRLQSSSLFDNKESVKIGELLGAQAIITGNVVRPSANDTHYYESRQECLDKKCEQVRRYRVSCINRDYSLRASVKMVDISKGEIIYSETFDKSKAYDHCSDDRNILPSISYVASLFSQEIAYEISQKLSPHRVFSTIEILDDDDGLDSDQEDTLENAIEFMEAHRFDKAEQLLHKIWGEVNENNYIVAYNLGVVYEAQNDLERAQHYYKSADKLCNENTPAINSALTRIQRSIYHNNKALEQLNR